MLTRRGKSPILVLAVAASAITLAACGSAENSSSGGGGGDSSGEIVIGTSIPLSGPLASYGAPMKPGMEKAVKEANDAGGIDTGDGKRKVKLIVSDNKSDPNLATQQARSAILEDGAHALLGSISPPLTIPMSNVAEQLKKPLVSSVTPVRAWLGGRPAGWKWAWDFYFDEAEFTDNQFKTADLVDTNKKIALFTDNEQDGVVMGDMWTEKAPTMGYEIAYHGKFPVGTTDYGSLVKKAKAAGAQVLIAQMIPPDGIALLKQMKSLDWAPKIVICEKCASTSAWPKALGPLAEGTITNDGGWSPARGNPRTDEFVEEFKSFGQVETTYAVEAYAAAKVLLDSIARAKSTDPAKINEAIGKTDLDVPPLGKIAFEADHHGSIKANHMQWRGDKTVQVYPADDHAEEIVSPPPGL